MDGTTANQNHTHKMVVVKSYESVLEGEAMRVVMYRLGQRYGVVTLFQDVAVALDYKAGDLNELRTFIGNETRIIDWVSIDLANHRYTNLLCQTIHQNKAPPRIRSEACLRLVQT